MPPAPNMLMSVWYVSCAYPEYSKFFFYVLNLAPILNFKNMDHHFQTEKTAIQLMTFSPERLVFFFTPGVIATCMCSWMWEKLLGV